MHAQSCAAASVAVAAKKIIDEFKLAPEAAAGWEEEQVVPAA